MERKAAEEIKSLPARKINKRPSNIFIVEKKKGWGMKQREASN